MKLNIVPSKQYFIPASQEVKRVRRLHEATRLDWGKDVQGNIANIKPKQRFAARVDISISQAVE